MISHVVLQKFWSTINKKVLFTYWGHKLFTVGCLAIFLEVSFIIQQFLQSHMINHTDYGPKPKSCKRSSNTPNQNSFWDSFPRAMRGRKTSWWSWNPGWKQDDQPGVWPGVCGPNNSWRWQVWIAANATTTAPSFANTATSAAIATANTSAGSAQ